MYKMGQPVSPLDVMLNGSQSQHAVSPEGISIASFPSGSGCREVLTIGYAKALPELWKSKCPMAMFRLIKTVARRMQDKSIRSRFEIIARMSCRSMDALLVSPGEASPFPVVNRKPDMKQGMAYNLLNNIWGNLPLLSLLFQSCIICS